MEERLKHGLLLAAGFCALAVLAWLAASVLLFGLASESLILYAVSTLLVAAVAPTAFVLAVDSGASLGALGIAGRHGMRLTLGLLLGAGGVGALVALLWLGGFLESRAISGEFVLADAAVLAALVAGVTAEELLFRGYGFQRLLYALGTWPPVLLAGLGFGLLHASNPGTSVLSVVNTALFGALFGYALVRSRSWWFPFGIHLGWNVALAATGAPLSGLRIKGLGWRMDPAGPELWSGGAYGPEASLLATVTGGALAFAIWRMRFQDFGEERLWDLPRVADGKEVET